MVLFSARKKSGVVLMAALFVMQGCGSVHTSGVNASKTDMADRAGSAGAASPAQFAESAFETTWQHTDGPVASGNVKRTWFWGPSPNTAGLSEQYGEGAGGKRLVQYFDKSRMEINNRAMHDDSPWYVTNGLLTVELISGRMQTGNQSYEQRPPANINVTGDDGDMVAPTYASFAGVSNANGDHRDPNRMSQDVTSTLNRAGIIGKDQTKAGVAGARIAYYEKITGHNIPMAMWTFLNVSGPVQIGGQVVQQRLMEPWFYASGLPISDPYWTEASIAGKQTDVLVQAYERRVLTYVPTNPSGFQVEMGNVGQHYYQWRYGNNQKPPEIAPPAPPKPVPTEMPEPVPTTSIRFAIDPNGDMSPLMLDGIAGSGAGAVRTEMPWATLEPNNVAPRRYDWAPMDTKLKRLAERGLSPIVLVDGCPKWACNSPGGPIRPDKLNAFVEFMSAVVARYSKAPYNVHYWELWNEPDSSIGEGGLSDWGMHAEEYASMLKAIRRGVLDADPNAKLIMGGLAYDNFKESGGPFNRQFLDEFLDAGGANYLDYFNFHYYVNNVNWCSLTEKISELRSKLASHNVGLPIICTETGLTSNSDYGSSPEIQSLYAAQAYAQALGERLESVAWYTARDFQTDVRGWQIFKDSGLLDANNKPKPAYQAYKWASLAYGQREVVRTLNSGDGVAAPRKGYEFGPDTTHNGALWVVWAWDFSVYAPCGSTPGERDFVIPASKASKVSRILDIYGNAVSIRSRGDGTLLFSLGAKPVYIEWR